MFEVLVHGKSYDDALCVGFRRGRPGPVPKSTLKLRVRNFIQAMGSSNLTDEVRSRITLDQLRPYAVVAYRGRRRYFSDSQELALATLLQGIALCGKAMSYDMVLGLMTQCAELWSLHLREASLSHHFITDFVKRHPCLRLRKGKILDATRRFSEANVHAFYDQVAPFLRGIDPRQLGNIDEAGCVVNGKDVTVIAAASSDVAHMAGEETLHPHITIAPTIVACGKLLITQFIYEHAGEADTTPHSEADGNAYSGSATGFIDERIFGHLMRGGVGPRVVEHLAEEGLHNKPFYLLIDGHKSHSADDTLVEDMVRDFNVHLVFIAPHTSHMCQPLDRGFFHPFKSTLRSLLAEKQFYIDKINLAERTSMVKAALISACGNCGSTIKNCFDRAGFIPWSPRKALEGHKADLSPRFQYDDEGQVTFAFSRPVQAVSGTSASINGNSVTTSGPDAVTVFETSAITTTPNGAVRNSRTVGLIVPSREITELVREAAGMVIQNGVAHQRRGIMLPGTSFGVASDINGPYNINKRARLVQQTIGNAPVALLHMICDEVGVNYVRETVGARQRRTLPRVELVQVLKTMIRDHLETLETAISAAQNRNSNQTA